MAEVAFTKPETAPFHRTYRWPGVTEADTCKPIKLDRAIFAYSMQVSGTFGGAAVGLHGSLDGTSFVPLKDRDGAAIALSAAGIVSGLDMVLWVKPVATSGSSQSVDITVMVGFQP